MNTLFENYFSLNGKCKNKDNNYLEFFTNFMRNNHLELEQKIK